MWLFRKTLDPRRAAPRPVAEADLTATAQLLRDGARRYYALAGGDLARVLAAGQGVALDSPDGLWGIALVSRPSEATCWLRALAIAEGVEVRAGVAALIPALHEHLAGLGVRSVYYSGEDSADGWLVPALQPFGYSPDTEVVVYEKRDWEVPDTGNRAVLVRPAVLADLDHVLRLDRQCFEPQWTKDDTILGPALLEGPFFVVAELDGELVGYAYATSHFGGRLVHLVRIAVDPRHRNERVGARLLAEVTFYAAEHRADMITLNTQAYNNNAQRLYRWFGFARTGERQIILRCNLREAALSEQASSCAG